ncbi:hypothetical protein ACI4CV_27540, partial [Klebsiella pneumoniae]|uniref:hypothetical protein n=1 Tax=Klebsiella pneumoniae TaxID=573 RepID=UPI0038544A4D
GPVRHGIVVRREALTLGADGVPVVWEQVQAETFVPHPVRTQELDGDNVIVTAGLSDGARIAVRGVRLLAQLY